MDKRVTALENSVSELKARVRRAEHDAAAGRTLAGSADRDTAELGSELREFRTQNTRVLNAMRADLTDLREHVDGGFAQVYGRFAEVDRQFAQVDRNFLTVHSKLDGVAAGLNVITDLLTRRERDDGPGS